MTLFLKSGPCFYLPRDGVLTGLYTWRFFVAFIINNIGTHNKVSWSRNELTTMLNMASNYLVSASIALHSLHQGLGSWGRTGEMVMKFPALIILPTFGFTPSHAYTYFDNLIRNRNQGSRHLVTMNQVSRALPVLVPDLLGPQQGGHFRHQKLHQD